MEEILVSIACYTGKGCTEATDRYFDLKPEVRDIIRQHEKHITELIGSGAMQYLVPCFYPEKMLLLRCISKFLGKETKMKATLFIIMIFSQIGNAEQPCTSTSAPKKLHKDAKRLLDPNLYQFTKKEVIILRKG